MRKNVPLKKIQIAWQCDGFHGAKRDRDTQKTKKSEREENIKPGIMKCELRGDSMYMLLSTGSEYNLKPELVMQALYSFSGIEHNQFHYHIHRLETYMDSLRAVSCHFIRLEHHFDAA